MLYINHRTLDKTKAWTVIQCTSHTLNVSDEVSEFGLFTSETFCWKKKQKQINQASLNNPWLIPNKPASSLINNNLGFNSNPTQITFVTLIRFLKVTKLSLHCLIHHQKKNEGNNATIHWWGQAVKNNQFAFMFTKYKWIWRFINNLAKIILNCHQNNCGATYTALPAHKQE